MPPDQPRLEMALHHHRAGSLEEAEKLYVQILQTQPNHFDALHMLGVVCAQTERIDHAVQLLRRALTVNAAVPLAHSNLGATLIEQGKVEEAMACYREALRLKPDLVDALNNLGLALLRQGKPAEAVSFFQEALRHKPDHHQALNNLAVGMHPLGRLDEAEKCYREALRLKPDYAQAHLGLARTLLLRGDFQRGWPEYEWRMSCKRYKRRSFARPCWDGSPLAGRTILVHAEQGLGDTLQFIRYARQLKAQGGRVILECWPALLGILSRTPGIDQLMAHDAPLPPFDVHVPLLSLPGILGTTLETIPAEFPYVVPDEALVQHWGSEFGRMAEFKVGICWQGDANYHGDCLRSIPLAQFGALAAIRGVRLVSLQKGPGTNQLAELAGRFPVLDLGRRLDEQSGPFQDTAAIMGHLDLVVTSDTAVAHLAGALGVPVWLALEAFPDWRWLLDREDCPWYPSMRLFRQNRFGDWGDVFARIAQAISELVAR